ncbi:DUF1634 domain-containing protein [bacterium]|nr:DUF1634 domain-containing protein [bacterium]
MRDLGGQWSDRNVERVVGTLLRTGVLLAAAVVIVGAIMFLFEHGTDRFDFHEFHGIRPEICTLGGIVHQAFTLHSRGIIQLGLLLLIATPVARVLFSVFAFALENDRVYVAITIVVLTILLFSLTHIS